MEVFTQVKDKKLQINYLFNVFIYINANVFELQNINVINHDLYNNYTVFPVIFYKTFNFKIFITLET